MNITVENLAPCRKLLRVELDAKSVDEIFDAITKDYQKQASLHGSALRLSSWRTLVRCIRVLGEMPI